MKTYTVIILNFVRDSRLKDALYHLLDGQLEITVITPKDINAEIKIIEEDIDYYIKQFKNNKLDPDWDNYTKAYKDNKNSKKLLLALMEKMKVEKIPYIIQIDDWN